MMTKINTLELLPNVFHTRLSLHLTREHLRSGCPACAALTCLDGSTFVFLPLLCDVVCQGVVWIGSA